MERVRQLEAYRRQEEEPYQPGVVSLPEAAEVDPAVEPAQGASVQVISGASVHTLALAGLQVSQARGLVETILRIDPRAPVLVNGQPVRPDYRLASGDTLEFVHQAGEKGGGHGAPH
jgi:hypothetical protein